MAEEERKLSVEEIRRTIATSLAGAFAFVIALLWTQVVLGGLGAAGISTTSPKDWGAWGIFAVAAAVITVVMVIMIILFSRWGSTK